MNTFNTYFRGNAYITFTSPTKIIKTVFDFFDPAIASFFFFKCIATCILDKGAKLTFSRYLSSVSVF